MPKRMVYPNIVGHMKSQIEKNLIEGKEIQPEIIVLWKNFISRGLHCYAAMVELGYEEVRVKNCDCNSCLKEKE